MKTETTDVQLSDGDGNVIFKGTDKEFHQTVNQIAFQIPDKKDFLDDEFLEAPELKKMGLMLIEKYENDFAHLVEANVIYLWKEKGGDSGGRATLGKCIRPTGLAKHFAIRSDESEGEKVDYIVWAAADHLRDNRANYRTVCALIFHELKHTAWDDGKLIVVGHEFEGFAREIEEFGMWQSSIKKIAEACETVKDVQQGLFTNQ
jgi:putative metallopeptidase